MSTPIPEDVMKAARDAFEQQIDGMCMTWDHSFGLLDDRQRDYLRRCFRQVGEHDVIPVIARALMAERKPQTRGRRRSRRKAASGRLNHTKAIRPTRPQKLFGMASPAQKSPLPSETGARHEQGR